MVSVRLLRRAGTGHQENGSQRENSFPRREGEHGLHGHDQHEPTTGEWLPQCVSPRLSQSQCYSAALSSEAAVSQQPIDGTNFSTLFSYLDRIWRGFSKILHLAGIGADNSICARARVYTLSVRSTFTACAAACNLFSFGGRATPCSIYLSLLNASGVPHSPFSAGSVFGRLRKPRELITP